MKPAEQTAVQKNVYYGAVDPACCIAEVLSGPRSMRWHQCTRKFTVQRESGNFCNLHDPVAKKAKRDAADEEFARVMDIKRKRWALEAAAPELLDACKEAIHQAEQRGECISTATTPEWVKQARAAISRAENTPLQP